MAFLKTKEQVISERLNSIHESVFKMGDLYKVRTSIDIPKSLINAFVSKAKKEQGTDPRENWSDIELAEMLVSYVTTNFINIESLPVNTILGEPTKAPGEASTEITSDEVDDVENDQNFDEPIISTETPLTPSDDMPQGEIEM
jgi:hypothetical protein